jgi:DNA-binding NarL/FixJ family response regulator
LRKTGQKDRPLLTGESNLIHVSIVSPNPALRIGLQELLGSASDIEVVEAVADFDNLNDETEVLVLASASPLDLDDAAPDVPAVLLLTDDPADVQQFASAGLSTWGALFASSSGEELIAAVRALGEGLWIGAPSLVQDLMRTPNRLELANKEELAEPLTERETEVLQLVAQGLANKQVALYLGISEHTVKFHLSSLYTKLNVASRTEAIHEGIQRGLIAI